MYIYIYIYSTNDRPPRGRAGPPAGGTAGPQILLLRSVFKMSCLFYIVAIFYPFSQFCEISISLLSLQTQPNTAPNLFQRGVEYGKYDYYGQFSEFHVCFNTTPPPWAPSPFTVSFQNFKSHTYMCIYIYIYRERDIHILLYTYTYIHMYIYIYTRSVFRISI